jgi:fibronectin type 3 domain-containing protein
MRRFSFKESLFPLLTLFLTACGGYGGGGNNGGGGGGTVPGVPSGLTATAGNAQVSLAWTAASGATTYNVKRGTTSGGPYTTQSSPIPPNFNDTTVTNGTTYYYVVSAVNAYGESANTAEKSATPILPIPAAPTGVTATAGDTQVSLSWTASANATSYHVKRSTTSGSGYAQAGAPTTTSFNDIGLTNGTPYYYVVTAVNASGESSPTSQVAATPAAASASVHVTVDVNASRHVISPYIYGVNFPPDGAYVTNTGATMVRWGGNAATRYNWKNFDTNAAADYYFINRPMGNAPLYDDSTHFITNIKAAGGFPITTVGMLPSVAKDSTGYSFSVSKYGAQCHTDPFNSDHGNGVKNLANCDSSPQYVTGNDVHDAHVPLLDSPGGSDPAGSVYRNQWVAALSTAFGASPHFYNMDNEYDIWSGTHRDVHPNPTTYDELRDTFINEARAVKGWDAQAVRFGPVSCCWYFYWNSALGGSDKPNHGGVDFFTWWLNEALWKDAIAGNRSLDVFDVHAYPETSGTGLTLTQQQALTTRITRDWWDPTYTSEAWFGTNSVTNGQPLDNNPARIIRLRALVNRIYTDTPLSFTEWNFVMASESDFSTALADADAWGILGRERVSYSTRWTAADPANPAVNSLKLFRNYDGSHHTFESISISATNDGDPNLFSSYAAVNAAGTTMTMMVVNKDPNNSVTTGFNFSGFTPSQVTKYTLAKTSPNTIATTPSQAWSSTQTFAPYSVTLLVISGTSAHNPTTEWDLNPDTILIPRNGTVTLHPKIVSGTGTVTLTSPQSDTGITVTLANGAVSTGSNGAVTVTAGNTSGFFHYQITGTDSAGVQQTQGGWILVGKPAATISNTTTAGNQQGPAGSAVTLSVTLAPGSSGGNAQGASIFFTTDHGSLSNRLVTTDSSGVATVTLTLPSGAGPVTITAEGPYGLGHPTINFTETAQ